LGIWGEWDQKRKRIRNLRKKKKMKMKAMGDGKLRKKNWIKKMEFKGRKKMMKAGKHCLKMMKSEFEG